MSEDKPNIDIHDHDDDDPQDESVNADDLLIDGNIDNESAEEMVENEFVDLAKKCGDLESKLLRAHADYQNVIRRSHQEVDNARERQLMDVAKDLLTVLDHFDHAVAIDPRASSAQDVLNGIMIVRDELTRTLERYGITRLDVEPGEEFDPNRHEALMRQASEDHETNQIVAQLQSGYLIKDKTLRPAKVSVAE